MSERRYTEDHEWIDLDGEIGTVGITDFAQEQLGEVVFVEVPDVGKVVAQGDETAVVESVKAASELYAPVTGEVVEANTALADTPDLVNSDPEGDAWFYKIKLSDKDEFDALMDADAYKAHTEA
ncbi:glycine cleavage system protein GcvH [Nisaea sp.]|uniref:glycine cleavage system protein GcvH n=1 Tax=Nisaea sp. TaxID=2024842 RepID=UPI0032ED9514